jgi:Kef-type K+ transport system membrane component KefB
MHGLLQDIAICSIAAWALGVLAHFARQPVILAYLVGGFAVGPSGLRLVQSQESVEAISELGLIFLLFMIGLEIDLKKVLSSGRTILATAAFQIVGGSVLGVLVFVAIGARLGGGSWDALYLGLAAALSSTVIIVKVLYDKRELDTLVGRITLGMLVLQDLAVILFLAVQPSLNDLRVGIVLLSMVRVAILVASMLLVSRYVLPHIFRGVARVPELVLVGALAWCFLGGELAHHLQLSREMGALIAGVSLSTFPYALDVTAKVTSLRDFFVTLFFVGLGMTVPVPSMGVLGTALVLAVFTVASRFLTTMPPLYLMGQGIRASFLPALNLAQVSEFSLVLMQLGFAAGHVTLETKNAASFAFVILAVLSTFAMTNSNRISRPTVRLLKRMGLRDLDAATEEAEARPPRIVLLGFFRTASSLIAELERENDRLLLDEVKVVDFNPVVLHGLQARGIRVQYGDISQRETLVHSEIAHAEILVSTVPDYLLKGITNEKLVRQLRSINPKATIIAHADVLADVASLYAAGADHVFVPRLIAAGELRRVLRAADDGLLGEKRAEVDHSLAKRSEVLG